MFSPKKYFSFKGYSKDTGEKYEDQFEFFKLDKFKIDCPFFNSAVDHEIIYNIQLKLAKVIEDPT